MNEDTQRPVGQEETQPTAAAKTDGDSGDTRVSSVQRTKSMRPARVSMPPAPRGTQPPAVQRYPRRPARTSPQDSGLYFPWWSIVLMLLAVLIVSFGMIGSVFLLGSAARNPAQPSPVVVIVTANPDAPQTFTQPTAVPPSTQVIFGGERPANLALQGPTLAPVLLTPTPAAIRIGSRVRVEGVDLQTLNVRDAADLTNSSVIFRAEEGEAFTVLDGPRQASGFTWWQIQSPDDATRIGWAVSNYLTVIPN